MKGGGLGWGVLSDPTAVEQIPKGTEAMLQLVAPMSVPKYRSNSVVMSVETKVICYLLLGFEPTFSRNLGS